MSTRKVRADEIQSIPPFCDNIDKDINRNHMNATHYKAVFNNPKTLTLILWGEGGGL